jgi:hypothetical protein
MVKHQNARREYSVTQTCNNCGHLDERVLSEEEASFIEASGFGRECPVCHQRSWTGSWSQPPLTGPMIEKWAADEGLHFSEQQEYMHVTEPDLLPVTSKLVLNPAYSISKRAILLGGLLYIAFDYDIRAKRKPTREFLRNSKKQLDELFDYLDNDLLREYWEDL